MFAEGTEYLIKIIGDDEPVATGGFDNIASLMDIIRAGWKDGTTIDIWSPTHVTGEVQVIPAVVNPDHILTIADVRGMMG